ncbi:MAG TPA: hypothetical protein VEK78_05795, partial [Gemmatimonadales bacterium]|nr:hypothetical protein [Gemmatimonadales bacterium]
MKRTVISRLILTTLLVLVACDRERERRLVGPSAATGDLSPTANLDQCANGGVGSAPVACTTGGPGGAWVNGNLNASKAHYLEGQSVPYRLRMDNVATAGSHTVTIEWDVTKGGKHALDYLTSFDRTESSADPCADVSGCSLAGPKSTYAIPVDANVTKGQNGSDDAPAGPTGGDDIAQVPGVFTLFNGTITSVSAYTTSGTLTGDASTRITITFTATASSPVLAWGGHIAARFDWGTGNSAIAIDGSPYHMALVDIDGKGGNQDHQLSSDAVIF